MGHEKNRIFAVTFCSLLFNGLRKKSDKMTMKSEIM